MGEGGVADLGVLESVLGELSGVLARSCVLVTKSAVPVGTSHRADVRVVSNPEFLGEGHAVRDFLHPDRIVIGSADSEAADHVSELYRATGAPVLRTEAASAEMAKYREQRLLRADGVLRQRARRTVRTDGR
jgi:UDPglucose 6-dehydrogenase